MEKHLPLLILLTVMSAQTYETSGDPRDLLLIDFPVTWLQLGQIDSSTVIQCRFRDTFCRDTLKFQPDCTPIPLNCWGVDLGYVTHSHSRANF